MTDFPGWPQPRFITTNGVRMGLFEAGTRGGRYPTIVLCHGFPELAFSWRHQVRDLAARGFHVIAPDQRGYGVTDAPREVTDYDLDHLVGDLIGMLDAEGLEKAVFCGHDWGGIVTWQIPLRHPERVAGMIGVNTPFIRRYPIDPIALFRNAFGEDMYIVFFQKPGEADAILAADVEKTFRFFMRRASGFTTPSSGPAAETERSLALVKLLEAYDPSTDQAQLLTPAELAYFVDAFKRTGFTGGINWYRNFTRNWERSAHLKDHVDAPSLMIMAELDAVLSPAMANGMEEVVPNLTRHLVLGSGHWTQQEKPEEVTDAIAGWMTKTFI
jgi:pimeloyl-ACP methyl ester carboxylesterase